MIFTTSERSRMARSAAVKPFVDGQRARFTNPGWLKLLPDRGSDTLYAAAVARHFDPSWMPHPVVEQVTEKLKATWRTIHEKDLTKGTIPELAEVYDLMPEPDPRLAGILSDWLALNQRGLSPGLGLYARVLAMSAIGCKTAEIVDVVLRGYAGNPSLIETIRRILRCGIPTTGVPFYWLEVYYGPTLWLWDRFKTAIRKAVSAEEFADLSQRMSAFTALPWNLLMPTGLHPQLGDDWKGDDGKVKPARLYVGKRWFYSFNRSKASNWFAAKADGPGRLRDLLATPEDGPLPKQANADWVACGDDGAPLLRKSRLNLLVWDRSPWTPWFTGGHDPKDKHGFPWLDPN